MDKAKYAEAKQVFEEIREELARSDLTPSQRDELEMHATRLAGVLVSPWLPVDLKRRLIMLGIVAFGLWQAAVGNYEPLLCWLLLPLFSPRIMGMAAFNLGRLRRVLG
jgi:hypothetical protein